MVRVQENGNHQSRRRGPRFNLPTPACVFVWQSRVVRNADWLRHCDSGLRNGVSTVRLHGSHPHAGASLHAANGAIAIASVLVLLVVHLAVPSLGVATIGIAYATGAWAVLLWGIFGAVRWWRATGRKIPKLAPDDIHDFKHSASAFLATDVSTFLLSVVGIWIAGYLLPTSQVGLYKAAAQLAILIEVILTVINLIIPTRFSKLFYSGNIRGLQQLARLGATVGGALALLPLAACLFAPEFILRVVGHDFAGAALLLQILAVGQLFNLGCGSVGHVLNMSGHEDVSRNIAWASNIAGLSMLVLGTYFLGVVGVALGVALAMSLRKVVGVYFTWRTIGVWTLPVPNFLRALHISGGTHIVESAETSLIEPTKQVTECRTKVIH